MSRLMSHGYVKAYVWERCRCATRYVHKSTWVRVYSSHLHQAEEDRRWVVVSRSVRVSYSIWIHNFIFEEIKVKIIIKKRWRREDIRETQKVSGSKKKWARYLSGLVNVKRVTQRYVTHAFLLSATLGFAAAVASISTAVWCSCSSVNTIIWQNINRSRSENGALPPSLFYICIYYKKNKVFVHISHLTYSS